MYVTASVVLTGTTHACRNTRTMKGMLIIHVDTISLIIEMGTCISCMCK